MRSHDHDPMNDILATVRDAITLGLFPETTLAEFNLKLASIPEPDKEDFLQDFWDRV